MKGRRPGSTLVRRGRHPVTEQHASARRAPPDPKPTPREDHQASRRPPLDRRLSDAIVLRPAPTSPRRRCSPELKPPQASARPEPLPQSCSPRNAPPQPCRRMHAGTRSHRVTPPPHVPRLHAMKAVKPGLTSWWGWGRSTLKQCAPAPRQLLRSPPRRRRTTGVTRSGGVTSRHIRLKPGPTPVRGRCSATLKQCTAAPPRPRPTPRRPAIVPPERRWTPAGTRTSPGALLW